MSKHEISYFVNGIEFDSDERKKFPKDILEDAGYNAEEYKLVRANAPQHDLPNDKIENIHNGEEFLALPFKPNPVSGENL